MPLLKQLPSRGLVVGLTVITPGFGRRHKVSTSYSVL